MGKLLRIPSAGTPLSLADLFAAYHGLWRPGSDLFQAALRARFHNRYAGLVDSGTTACYITLKALAGRSPRREVVIPAYTAPSLTLPIRKAGLVPRLCDIDPDTFNLDTAELPSVIGPDTLCVMPVHMFGLPCDLERIRAHIAGRAIVLVEDAASSFGSRVVHTETGAGADIGFFSFNRGKNLSTLSGGAVITDNPEWAALIEEERKRLPPVSRKQQIGLILKLLALAVAVRPLGYTMLYPLVKRYKYTTLHTDFFSSLYPDALASTGVSLLERAETLFQRRHDHGLYLLETLHGISGVRIPRPITGSFPVFNQFPVLVENSDCRSEIIRNVLSKTGVEMTTLYPEPLHRIYEMGYSTDPDPFPNATRMARHLLLIPTHPLIKRATLTHVVRIIRSVVSV